jgi:hypothetical protein
MEGRYISGILCFKDLRTAEMAGFKFYDAPKGETYYVVTNDTGKMGQRKIMLAHANRGDVVIHG